MHSQTAQIPRRVPPIPARPVFKAEKTPQHASEVDPEVKRALDFLDALNPDRADDRDNWLKVGMALHSVDPDDDDLLEAWIAWSQQSDKFEEGVCEAQWSKFKPGGGITIGSLIHWAEEDKAKLPVKRAPVTSAPSASCYPTLASLHKAIEMSKGRSTADQAIEDAGRATKGGILAQVWSYPGDIARVARFNRADGKKEFRPVHRLENGRWDVGDAPDPWPLYHSDQLLATGPVYICEGERATDAAWSVGLPTVTSAHGANSAGKTNWSPLAGREVVILPDADPAGEKYARDVTKILLNLDPKTRVKVVRLPGLPESGDIVEFLAAGGTAADIESLATKTQELTASDVNGGPLLICLADVAPIQVPWLWKGRIPLGRMTLLVGRPGEGKSFFTMDAAARVSTGSPWPDGRPCQKGSVLIISGEDDPQDTIRPRLDALNADVSQVHTLSMVRRIDEKGKVFDVMFTLSDLQALETVLTRLPDCKLIIVDPIGSFLGGETDSHRDNEVRAILAPVARLAEKYGVAILVVAHRRKGGGNFADDLAMGSRAFTGLARAVWHLSRDPNNKARRLLLPGKNNLAPEADGLAFTIGGSPPSISWERDSVAMSADEALALENQGGDQEESKPGPEPEALLAAMKWLKELMAGEVLEVSKIRAEADSAGLAWRTVHRAVDALGWARERIPGGGAWQWRATSKSPEDANLTCQAH